MWSARKLRAWPTFLPLSLGKLLTRTAGVNGTETAVVGAWLEPWEVVRTGESKPKCSFPCTTQSHQAQGERHPPALSKGPES